VASVSRGGVHCEPKCANGATADQVVGYKVGHSTINRLREHARTALGARYDFRKFNDAVVRGGNVPMTVLGHIVDAYIANT
jgi:uncharacterized protein (DUF885 family)